jgi:hypothetical protein
MWKAEGIFRIAADNSQEEYVREQLNGGVVPEGIDVHCLAGLIKVYHCYFIKVDKHIIFIKVYHFQPSCLTYISLWGICGSELIWISIMINKTYTIYMLWNKTVYFIVTSPILPSFISVGYIVTGPAKVVIILLRTMFCWGYMPMYAVTLFCYDCFHWWSWIMLSGKLTPLKFVKNSGLIAKIWDNWKIFTVVSAEKVLLGQLWEFFKKNWDSNS